MNYYRPIVENINKELGREAIALHTVLKNDNVPYLLYSGRAIDYILSNRNKFVPFGSIPVKSPDLFNHRIKIINNEVFCRLFLAANGNLGFDEERSFDLEDKMSFGNIMDSDITSLITKHNENCLLRCEETDDINTYVSASEFVPNINSDSRIYLKIVGQILKKFYEVRIIAKEKFRYVPAQDIIAGIPFPMVSNKQMVNLVERLYIKCKGQPMNPFSRTYELKYILNILENDNDIYFFPDYDFGTLNDLFASSSFMELKRLNDKYKNEEKKPYNNRTFKCYDDE